MSDKDDDKKDEGSPTGRAKGGKARAAALSPERRSEIARTAARAKHGTPPKATHKGNFKDEFGIDVECYVLDDEQKTAVISQRGMGAALGLGVSGTRLREFINRQKLAKHVGHELLEKLANPLFFQWPSAGVNQPLVGVNGYDVTILVDVCRVITAAAAAGVPLTKQVVAQANIILGASSKAGIKGLVYALAGYDATREEIIQSFRFYIREEAREYEREFPEQLYREWYRLYQLPEPERNRPWKFRALTISHVYKPLAKSNGVVLDLTRTTRANSNTPHKKLHQFLSEVGVKALRTHLGQLLGIAQLSDTSAAYEKNVQKVFGEQLSWDF